MSSQFRPIVKGDDWNWHHWNVTEKKIHKSAKEREGWDEDLGK